MDKTILVTGGAGFIGSNFILHWMSRETAPVINLDKLTYAGNPHNLERVTFNPHYELVRGDICDRELVDSLFAEHHPRAVVHFAAESHVDRSIHGPDDFVRTNVNHQRRCCSEVTVHCLLRTTGKEYVDAASQLLHLPFSIL